MKPLTKRSSSMWVKIKAPMTEYAEQLNIGKLELIMEVRRLTQHEIINNVIELGWRGIFPPKLPPEPGPRPHSPQRDPIEETEARRDTKRRLAKLTNNIKGMP